MLFTEMSHQRAWRSLLNVYGEKEATWNQERRKQYKNNFVYYSIKHLIPI